MKKALLSIAALTLLATQGSAQITITNTSLGTISGTTDIVLKANANSYITIAGPTHINTPRPTGYTWDLSTIYGTPDTMPAGWVYYRHIPQTGYTYADSITENMSLTGSPYSFEANILTNVTPTGVVQSAHKVMRKVYSLSGLTGGTVNDSLVILDQTSTYYNPGFSTTPAPRTHIQLPLTMGTPVWNNNFFYSVKAVVNYAAGLMVNDTIERKRYVVDQQTVIGYGSMKVRNKYQVFSDYFNVLQLRVNFIQITDSFYIEGVLATNLQLAPFGLTQGQDTTMYKDYYYRPGKITPLLNLQYTDGSRNSVMQIPAGRSLVDSKDLNPSSVGGVELNDNFAIFPNPVKSGGTLTIDLKDATANGNWTYNMINVTGQKVTEGALNINAGKTNITLPKLPTGIYYIQATNGQSKIVKAMEIE